MELVDEAHGAIPEPPPGRLAERGDFLAIDPDLAGGRVVQAAEQLQQGRLAGARSPDDRDPLAGLDLEVEVLEHGERDGPLPELLAQASAGEHGRLGHGDS
jgi:hypothetical protein